MPKTLIPSYRNSAATRDNPVIEQIREFLTGKRGAHHMGVLARSILGNDFRGAMGAAVGHISFEQLQDAVHFVHWEVPSNIVEQFRSIHRG